MAEFKERLVSSAYNHSEDMTKTWVSRLTDNSNLWLKAVRYEDEKDLNGACILYLKDAKEALNSGSFLKAALSCSCAAGCLVNIGYNNYARKFYLESAKMYEENADSAVKTSIREALWSLEKAYINYILARENSRSEIVYNKFSSLSKKVNPFLNENDIVKLHPMIIPNENGKQNSLSAELRKELTDFLEFRNSQKIRTIEKVGVLR